MKQARLLIVDDHPIVRHGLVELISRQEGLMVSGEAEEAEAALALVQAKAFDIVLVDLSLQGLSGLELIKQVKEAYDNLPMLVLSIHDEAFYAERALRAGARGYVMKQEPVETILYAIRRVLDGEIYVSDRVSKKMLHKFIGGKPEREGSLVERLSGRELEVFQLIGQGYGTRQIAEMLFLSIKTIESYRAKIKDKLRLKNASELIQHAVQWVQTVGTQVD